MLTTDKVAELKRIVSDYTGTLDPEQLNATGQKMTRRNENVMSRYIIMYCIKERSKLQLREIGDYFALYVDHATILHGIKTIKDTMSISKTFTSMVNAILTEWDEVLFGSPAEAEAVEQIESYFLVI